MNYFCISLNINELLIIIFSSFKISELLKKGIVFFQKLVAWCLFFN